MRPGLAVMSAIKKVIAVTHQVTDDFNRADGGLGGNWALITGGSALSVASNRVSASASGCMANHNTAISSADHYSQLSFVSGDISALVRVDITTGSFYQGRYSGGVWEIYRRFGGAYTQLASFTDSAPSAGTIIRMEAQGTAIRLLANGTLKVSTTDTNNTSSTRVGIRGNAGAVADDFAAGAL